jgi:hypothetical protein
MKIATCKICRRSLKNEASVARGIGPECAERFVWMKSNAGLTLEALDISESIAADPVVARCLHFAELALLIGRRSDMERFKISARDAARRASALTEVA